MPFDQAPEAQRPGGLAILKAVIVALALARIITAQEAESLIAKYGLKHE